MGFIAYFSQIKFSMASVRLLKKKIKLHIVQVVAKGFLYYDSNKEKEKALKGFIEDVVGFTSQSIYRINAARGMEQKERKAELKSVEEQFRDKQILYLQSLQ